MFYTFEVYEGDLWQFVPRTSVFFWGPVNGQDTTKFTGLLQWGV
jgi:hypothetical protein